MIPYRGIVAALGIATHDNVPVVILARGTPARNHEASIRRFLGRRVFFRDVIEEAKLKPIPFTQSRLGREIKETGAKQTLSMNCEIRHMDDEPGRARAHNQYCRAGHRRVQGLLSIIVLATRSLGIGASSSHRGGEAYPSE